MIKDSTEALRIDPTYTKALVRRAQAYEATDKLTDALKGTAALLLSCTSWHFFFFFIWANVAVMLMVMPRRYRL